MALITNHFAKYNNSQLLAGTTAAS